jgi:hypothetical protein
MRLALLSFLLSSGCYLSHERPLDAAPAPDAPGGPRLWALVHPDDAPMGAGLFLVDEGRGVVVRHLPLPDGLASPEGLTWDGSSLWLSDGEPSATGPAMHYELSPDDGSVRDVVPTTATLGMAWDPATDTRWSSVRTNATRLVRYGRTDEWLETLELGAEATPEDLVLVGETIYFVTNDETDRIVRLDLAAPRETREIARHVAAEPRSLGFDGEHLAIATGGTIRRFDRETGAVVGERTFPVTGLVTAIVFVP